MTDQDEPVGFMLLTGGYGCAVCPIRTCVVRVSVRDWLNMRVTLAPGLTTNVNEQNTQAVGFYKKMGFKVTGVPELTILGNHIHC